MANPSANAAEIVRVLEPLPTATSCSSRSSASLATPAPTSSARRRCWTAACGPPARIAQATAGRAQLVVVGVPIPVGNSLFNCAVAIGGGAILGIVPKQYIPNYKEFYESRWFSPAAASRAGRDRAGRPARARSGSISCSRRRSGKADRDRRRRRGHRDLRGPLGAGAPERALRPWPGRRSCSTSRPATRRSARAGIAPTWSWASRAVRSPAYAMAGCGPSESTTDVVFGGHCLIAENGRLLAESPRVGDGQPVRRDSYWITRDVDVAKLRTDRRVMTSFDDGLVASRPFRRVAFALARDHGGAEARGAGHAVRAGGRPRAAPPLRRDLRHPVRGTGQADRTAPPRHAALHLGISGGLDSTLALLVAVTTCDMLGLDRRQVHGLTMPGFGTTQRTRTNALALMEHLGVSSETIDISALALQTFQRDGPRPVRHRLPEPRCRIVSRRARPRAQGSPHDLTFENVQARLRTFLLMSKGFVVGTGDLSELALGWSTYNGDHMSMYNPNCSIPKTLVKFLVRYVALNQFPEGAGAADVAVDRGDDDLAGAVAGRSGRRDRAIDRGDARPLRAARLHPVSRGSLRILARQDLVPERVRHVHPALSPRADRADDRGRFSAGSSASSTSGRASPTGPRSARSACRPAATGECRPTPIRPRG